MNSVIEGANRISGIASAYGIQQDSAMPETLIGWQVKSVESKLARHALQKREIEINKNESCLK